MTGNSLSCALFGRISSLLQEPEQGIHIHHCEPLADGLFALTVHPEDGDRNVRSSFVLGLLDGCERGESSPSLEFERHPRRTENVTTLTACPCRFSIRE